MSDMYNNPVQRGFFPDPSVVRVGDDYYMANSTFQYFPAIAISHSKDMIHWHVIGHAITDSEELDLRDIKDSHGIWVLLLQMLPVQTSNLKGEYGHRILIMLMVNSL
jgi:xylan 1,4-beta-xylosidase